MESINIREFTLDDYEAVTTLWRRVNLTFRPRGRDGPENIRTQLERRDLIFLLAESGGEVVGCVMGTQDGRKGWINRLVVDESCRREGIGKN